ncbi:MAG: PAS domain S-box protein, partial [Candidatus Nanopelagicales bacterium]
MTSLRKLNASTASWILALSLPAIALADLLAPSLEPLPLVVVPVVASAVLGNPRFTAVLLAAALVIVVSLEAIQDQLSETGTWLRSCAILIVGLISVLISAQIRSRRQLLAASEQRFRLMAEHATDVVYLASLDRRITWVSPSIEHTLGWPPQDVVDTQMADLVHPDDREATESLRQRIYSGRAFVSPKEGYLLRVRHRDGRYLWMTNKLTFVTNDQGENVGVVGGLTLVDDLVEARARAQFDEELLRVTIDGVIDPVVLLQAVRDEDDTVVDFIYLDVNVAACEYLLMPASALIGELVSVTVPNTVKAGLFAKYLQVAQTGESLVCDAYRYQTAEGGLGRYFDVRASPVSRDRITVTWREVTGRAVAEGLLQESESRFRLLAENVSDVVFLADPSMNLSWVGASAQTAVGWAANDLIGRNATTFIHPDDLESVKSAIDFSRRTGKPAQLRFRWQLPDGDFTWVEALGKPVDDTGLGQPGRVISLRNVDAQVRAEQELDRSEANYRLLAENSSDVIMRMDRSGVVEWVSPSVDSALGWEPRDWVGQMATSFVHPDEIA